MDLPRIYSLSQNYPNPFNPTTEILYTIPEKEREGVGVTVFIYNVRGQLMRSFKEGKKLPGSYRIVWDGKGDSGVKVSSGVYFYRMHAGDYITTRKMVMAK
jgi:flagellar hook assembly protein FlgD